MRQAPTLLVVTAAFAFVLAVIGSSATANPSIASKEAQARAVLEQIQVIDSKAGKVPLRNQFKNQRVAVLENFRLLHSYRYKPVYTEKTPIVYLLVCHLPV